MGTRLAYVLAGCAIVIAVAALVVAVVALGRDNTTTVSATSGTSTALCQDALTRRQNAESALAAAMPAGGNATAWVAARDEARKQKADAENAVRTYCK